jgi:hypothetical protein
MEISNPERDIPYSYVTIIPWFYEEEDRYFTLTFNLLGFKAYVIPVKTMSSVLQEHLGAMNAYQVVHDSRHTSPPVIQTSPFLSPVKGTGLSPGDDLLFFTDRNLGEDAFERFEREARESIEQGLVEHIEEVFDPQVFLLKRGNRWMVFSRDAKHRTEIMATLFSRVAEKILRKSGTPAAISVVPRDSADRFIARGQVKWWMKGRMEGDAVVIEGDGLRPGEVTSADWALVTIPVDRS